MLLLSDPPISTRAVHDRSRIQHGGAGGLRDEGLLQSALARPQPLEAYGETVDVVDLAAAYTAGVVQNNPFIDGNRRTGFVLGVLFLELNGPRFAATEEAATQAVLNVAAGTLGEDEYAAFVRENISYDGSPRAASPSQPPPSARNTET